MNSEIHDYEVLLIFQALHPFTNTHTLWQTMHLHSKGPGPGLMPTYIQQCYKLTLLSNFIP